MQEKHINWPEALPEWLIAAALGKRGYYLMHTHSPMFVTRVLEEETEAEKGKGLSCTVTGSDGAYGFYEFVWLENVKRSEDEELMAFLEWKEKASAEWMRFLQEDENLHREEQEEKVQQMNLMGLAEQAMLTLADAATELRARQDTEKELFTKAMLFATKMLYEGLRGKYDLLHMFQETQGALEVVMLLADKFRESEEKHDPEEDGLPILQT